MSTPTSRSLAVVTGASSGIGKAHADRLAAQGHALLLVAHRQDRLTEVATDLASRDGVPVDTLVADLEQPADLSVLAQRLDSKPVAVLVNNAGAGGLADARRRHAGQHRLGHRLGAQQGRRGLQRLQALCAERASPPPSNGWMRPWPGWLLVRQSPPRRSPTPPSATGKEAERGRYMAEVMAGAIAPHDLPAPKP